MPRKKLDQYYTPSDVISDLEGYFLQPNQIKITGSIFDPCYGGGAFSSLYRNGKLTTNDIDPIVETDHKLDMTFTYNWVKIANVGCYDWVISNPPFNVACPIIENSLVYGRNVLMLLRLSFLEPTIGRSELLMNNPPSAIIVTPRISFTNDKKVDSVTTAWFYWHNGTRFCPGINFIPHPKSNL